MARGSDATPQVHVTRSRGVTALAVAALVTLGGAMVPSPLLAQYFGQNKVRYSEMDFKVLETEHFDVHFYDEARDAAFEFGRMAERWHARLSAVFGGPLSSRQTIVLYASHPDFRGTTVVPSEIGETTGGLTESVKRRIVMPLSGPLADTDHVLGHELVHAFQFDLVERLSRENGRLRGGAFDLPLWFIEGMAEYLSVGPVDAHTAIWLRDGVAREALPDLVRLDDPQYFPYRWGHAFWAYVAGRYGDGVVQPLLTAAVSSGNLSEAVKAVLGVEPVALANEWHASVRRSYAPAATTPETGRLRPLLADAREGRLNVGPSISPDGSLVAFYSERDGFAIDLFVADVGTGAIRRQLTELAVDPHTDSLQFVNVAGTWSADSRRLAFAGIAQGRPQLTIADATTGRIERRIPLGELGDVFSASWSPDGRTIVVSGMARGYVDLFLVDLEEGSVARLTDDAFTELQPSWSEDGRTIAFVTDRFTTHVPTLTTGDLRLARMEVATRVVRPLPAFERGKHLNPHWSPDGTAVVFVADHDGSADVYRLTLANGHIARLTAVPSGVTGIASNSPALSVAPTGRMVVTVHERGGYQLYVLDDAFASHAEASAVDRGQAAGGSVGGSPDRSGGAVSGTLPGTSGFSVRAYQPRLRLESIAPLQAGVGVSELGPLASGGTAAIFSDVLGQHRLAVGLQGTAFAGGGRGIDALSLVGGYQNERRLWTWGLSGGQFAYPSTERSSVLGFVGDEPVLIEQEIRSREVSRELRGMFTRPWSRARRVELGAGYEHLSFRADSRLTVTSLLSGAPLADERQDLRPLNGLHMMTTHAAVVHDTSVFAGTSPVRGERYRLQASVAAGSATYVTALADYRRYVPLGGAFSLAGRAMHFGRYGVDAEDPRMGEMFIGYPHLLRGYDSGAFAADCRAGVRSCQDQPTVFGSRLALVNLELRSSVGGYRGLVPRLGLPVEAALFVDAGLPWSSRAREASEARSRRLLTSVGAALRVNIFGSAVGQLAYSYAPALPGAGWRWQFSLTPGF